MPQLATDRASPALEERRLASARIDRLRRDVQGARPGVCTERAVLWTRYFRRRANRRKPAAIQVAEALRDVLLEKSIAIHPGELIAGNYTSRRVGGSVFPELHGPVLLEDLFSLPRRKTNPLEISQREMLALLRVLPFWLFRFLGIVAWRSPLEKLRFVHEQLRGIFYFINESGGIAHLAPDYPRLIALGTDTIAAQASERQRAEQEGSEGWCFLEGVRIAAEALASFGERHGRLAAELAEKEPDGARRRELEDIARVCLKVPRHPASSFHEALQSLFFAQVALNLESLDNAISPGRMDQYLLPYYEADLRDGRLTREGAWELLAAFSIKTSEIVPVFSSRITRFHGGMFNGQVVTVGGMRPDGADGTNELTWILLEVMDALRMRQPNFHARVHGGSPAAYLDAIGRVLVAGAASPALYNDDVIVETMTHHGYALPDARDYTAVGCVEPVSQGKSFSSTDAALVNLPILLELALNEGRRFGSFLRSGTRTPPVSRMRSMQDVTAAFEAQLAHQVYRLIRDLHAVEAANRRVHPTPMTSMLVDGCVESARCSTAGGARYNFSGIQGVGPADAGDALAAIEQAVFIDGKLSLPALVRDLARDLPDERRRLYLAGLRKYGNDDPAADRWMAWVAGAFARALEPYRSTRGGRYVPGLYSVTAHQQFGRVTGALPHGRRRGKSFASGISPVNGMDSRGPTALFNSANRIDFKQIANGVNLNVKFDPHTLRGRTGLAALTSLVRTYFRRGGMQVQINVLDPKVLLEARDHPELYPHLLVRVSGYSAYFNDLTPEMKDELIRRTTQSAGDRAF